MSRTNTYQYYKSCVDFTPGEAHRAGGLVDMIGTATDITRRTFLGHVDREDLARVEEHLGYVNHPSQGLTMAGDWHVSYHRSKLYGRRVYYFRHSRIEYVFTGDDTAY